MRTPASLTTVPVSNNNNTNNNMQCVYFLVVVATLAVAEPPSHSYLPPSPTSRNNGYLYSPEGKGYQATQIVAARNSQNSAISFGNSPGQYHAAARATSQGYEDSAPAFARNSIEANSEPANYNFGYMVNDFSEGTDFGHREERIEEKAQGQYHVVLPDGRKQIVNYEADERGFKPQISYEDSETLARSSGYDSNANNLNHGNYKNGGHDSRGY